MVCIAVLSLLDLLCFLQDLISDLKKELGGDFEDVIVGLMMQPIEYEATELRKAMKGAGTDEKALIEILLTKTNDEMQRLVDCYNSCKFHAFAYYC